MTSREQISVYLYQPADDGFGEYLPAAPVLQATAPRWADIRQTSGDDLFINERNATLNRFELTVNWGFTFTRTMFIVTRFGNLDITGIAETQVKRKVTLQCAFVAGVTDTGSGDATTLGGLYTVYYTVASDGDHINIPQLIGKEPMLFFRDGIEKTIVDAAPAVNEVMIDTATGNVTLVANDIFAAGERITVMYKQ